MPPASRWLVGAALGHLVLGGGIGVAWLVRGPEHPPPWPFLPALHVELMLLGWVFQLVAGVALWILPRSVHGGPARSPAVGFSVLGLTEGGLLFVALGVAGPLPEALLAGRVFEGAAAVLFAWHAGRRVWMVPGVPPAPRGGARVRREGAS